MAIGRASKTKINANMGASPVSSGTDEEVEKLKWSQRWGADTAMDLSTGGDLDACREALVRESTVPIGTVPIYSMIIGRRIEDLDEAIILETLEHQAAQGVDYFTIHAGVRPWHLPAIEKRLIGIVSRGASLLAKWMITHFPAYNQNANRRWNGHANVQLMKPEGVNYIHGVPHMPYTRMRLSRTCTPLVTSSPTSLQILKSN